jgi:endonuclease YncB( thermonuclease family)
MGSLYNPYLKKLTHEHVQRFTLKGIEAYTKVVSVYDGDTCDVIFHHNGDFVRYKCRLLGYDTPELDDEPSGELARDYLAHLCTGGKPGGSEFLDVNQIWTKQKLQQLLNDNENLVYATFGKQGKYGRPLVTLYQTPPRSTYARRATTQSINDMMKKFVEKLE